MKSTGIGFGAENALTAVINLMPIGTIMPFAGNAATAKKLNKYGWFLCNGTALAAEAYPRLFQILGNACGGTAGEFNVPDLRGMFLRGVDLNDGEEVISRDPDANTRKSHTGDTEVGNRVLSRQDDVFKSHQHKLDNGAVYADTVAVTLTGQEEFDSFNKPEEGQIYDTVNAGGAETRPVNVSVNYIIYAGPGAPLPPAGGNKLSV